MLFGWHVTEGIICTIEFPSDYHELKRMGLLLLTGVESMKLISMCMTGRHQMRHVLFRFNRI